MKPVCYLDLDGVITNFHVAALALHQSKLEEKDLINWDLPGLVGMSPDSFYKDMGYDFWANLPWVEEGKELLKRLTGIFGSNLILLSSPVLTSGCAEGKRDWVSKNLPTFQNRLFLGSAKHLLAASSKILVDDSDLNCTAFHEAGGFTVLVPAPWNRLRALWNNGYSVDYVIEKVLFAKSCTY